MIKLEVYLVPRYKNIHIQCIDSVYIPETQSLLLGAWKAQLQSQLDTSWQSLRCMWNHDAKFSLLGIYPKKILTHVHKQPKRDAVCDSIEADATQFFPRRGTSSTVGSSRNGMFYACWTICWTFISMDYLKYEMSSGKNKFKNDMYTMISLTYILKHPPKSRNGLWWGTCSQHTNKTQKYFTPAPGHQRKEGASDCTTVLFLSIVF